MLGLHFVSKGVLEKEHGKTFSRLFEIRHSGDYDDFVYCDKEMTDEYTPMAKTFVQRIKELLQENILELKLCPEESPPCEVTFSLNDTTFQPFQPLFC